MLTSLYHNITPTRSTSPPVPSSHQVLPINNVNAATFFDNAPKMPPRSRQQANAQPNSALFTSLPPATPQTISNGVKIFKRNRLLNAVVSNQNSNFNTVQTPQNIGSSGSLMSHFETSPNTGYQSPLQNIQLQNTSQRLLLIEDIADSTTTEVLEIKE